MIPVGAAIEPLGVTSPVSMTGFAARTEPSTGEHDELGARALAIDEVVLITLDVCALEEGTCRAIATGVRPDAPDDVIVTATHTHAGPCSTPTRLTRCDPETERTLVRAAVRAGQTARAARQLCTVDHRSARGVGVASNRRHPDRTVDPPVQMLRFAHGSSTVAALLTYPCHPVVLDATNRLLSADYVHTVRSRVEQEHPGSVAVFATGCAGDINTGHSASASFSLQGSATRTFAEAERVGSRVSQALLASEATPVAACTARLATSPVTLAMDRPDHAELQADQEAWTHEIEHAEPGRAALLRIWLDWSRAVPTANEWNGRVSVFRLGEVTVVALPGEPFLDVAERIAEQVGGPCLVLGYADGCPGYLPTADEYAHGGYEVADAHRYYGMPGPFVRGSAEMLIESAVEACRALE